MMIYNITLNNSDPGGNSILIFGTICGTSCRGSFFRRSFVGVSPHLELVHCNSVIHVSAIGAGRRLPRPNRGFEDSTFDWSIDLILNLPFLTALTPLDTILGLNL
jgi:hypothetical protein